ncbi:MAG: TetR/AcrR family transcriptional regulator [Myxococcota bacterium]
MADETGAGGGERSPSGASVEDGSIRERILTEAARLFAHKGYAATSVREITQAAGATNPMMYYYFGSKAELYEAILSESMCSLSDRVEAILERQDQSFQERLVELVVYHFELVVERPDAARLFFRVFFGPDEEQQLIAGMRQMSEAHECLMARAIEEAQARNELRPCSWRMVEMLLGGMVMHPILKYLDHEDVELNRETAEALVELFMSGVGADKTTTSSS